MGPAQEFIACDFVARIAEGPPGRVRGKMYLRNVQGCKALAVIVLSSSFERDVRATHGPFPHYFSGEQVASTEEEGTTVTETRRSSYAPDASPPRSIRSSRSQIDPRSLTDLSGNPVRAILGAGYTRTTATSEAKGATPVTRTIRYESKSKSRSITFVFAGDARCSASFSHGDRVFVLGLSNISHKSLPSDCFDGTSFLARYATFRDFRF